MSGPAPDPSQAVPGGAADDLLRRVLAVYMCGSGDAYTGLFRRYGYSETVDEALAHWQARRRDDAAAAVNVLLCRTGARPVLDRHGNEPWHLHFHGADDSLVSGWTAGCATGLAIVLGSDWQHGRIGVCGAGRCDRVYVDSSRNGTRRFCSTACQNRVKAAAFRARQAAP